MHYSRVDVWIGNVERYTAYWFRARSQGVNRYRAYWFRARLWLLLVFVYSQLKVQHEYML